jgi:hypothetical protein
MTVENASSSGIADDRNVRAAFAWLGKCARPNGVFVARLEGAQAAYRLALTHKSSKSGPPCDLTVRYRLHDDAAAKIDRD